MTTKSDLPPIPEALADVALVDSRVCAAAMRGSVSSWLELVRTKCAPAPVIRQPRFTRWRLADLRAWLEEQAARGSDPSATRTLEDATRKASAAAQSKRRGVVSK